MPESVGAVRAISEKIIILPVRRFPRDEFFLKGWPTFAYTHIFSMDSPGGFLGAEFSEVLGVLAGRYSRAETFSEVLGDSKIHIIMINHKVLFSVNR